MIWIGTFQKKNCKEIVLHLSFKGTCLQKPVEHEGCSCGLRSKPARIRSLALLLSSRMDLGKALGTSSRLSSLQIHKICVRDKWGSPWNVQQCLVRCKCSMYISHNCGCFGTIHHYILSLLLSDFFLPSLSSLLLFTFLFFYIAQIFYFLHLCASLVDGAIMVQKPNSALS